MNKQVSVQYAYKKDGKGERHGDQAERMLAAEAKKHITQPIIPTLPAQIFSTQSPAPLNPANATPSSTGLFINGRQTMNFVGPPPPQQRPMPQPQVLSGPPPAGLPPRPPPSQAGYGGPQNFLPPGFGLPQQGPGFSAPGPPPGLPPGFQSTSSVRSQ